MSLDMNMPETRILPRPTAEDLPPDDTVRWIARRKAIVVAAIQHGLISEDEACNRYSLTMEELESWCISLKSHGVKGLRASNAR